MKKRPRWTILDVDEDIIEMVKLYSEKNGYRTARSLKELVINGISKNRKFVKVLKDEK